MSNPANSNAVVLTALGGAILLVIAMAYVLSSPQPGSLQLVVSILLLVTFVITTLSKPAAGLTLVSAALPFLGVFRRILFQQSPVQNDPLLLIIPIYSLFMLSVVMWTRREELSVIVRHSLTARLMIGFFAVMTLQILNPLQGGLVVGVAGALFYLIPLCWYFIGRIYLTDLLLRRILTIFIVSSVVAALYGLMQTFVGFPDYDSNWIKAAGTSYQSLNVLGSIRALGPTTSAAEYSTLLACGLICLLSLALFRWQLLALIPAGLLGVAIILESSRGVVVLVIATFIVLLALRQRSKRLAMTVLAIVVIGGGFAYQKFSETSSITPISLSTGTAAATSGFLAHQINGLAHPFDQQYSTGGGHLQQILTGLGQSLKQPFGYGLGATTLSASKFGGTSQSAENDVVDVFLSGGVIGGVLYVLILYRTLVAGGTLAFRYKRMTDVLPFVAVAVSFGQTLNGGYYSLMPFLWLYIAWIDIRATDVLGPERVARRERRHRPAVLTLAPRRTV